MYTLVAVLIIIVSVLLILIVLVQNSKGGGLAANFSAANQIMGARRSADFLEKATWTLASALLFLSLVATVAIPREKEENSKSKIQDQIENAVNPESMPAFPTTAPAQPSQGTEEQTE
ncbi:MAG: preprotein translocase subunit SecG [Bacteroidales bacterium]|nr:preprotein translocase subunit SecG [Bacteroidales bacterium]